MSPFLNRTELLLGKEHLEKIKNAKVIIFGVGGVGSWCAEGLIRSGIKHLTIVDSDRVCLTNINRQLQATTSTVGKVKVEVLAERLLDINPSSSITALQQIYSAKTSDFFNLSSYDFVIDAIDSLSNKVHLMETVLTKTNAKLFSSMGAALKLDPSLIKIGYFWKIKGCPLAKALRARLRKTGCKNDFLCVYSEERLKNLGEQTIGCGTKACICPKNKNPESELDNHEWCSKKAVINGSLAHITAIYGFMLSGLVIKELG